MAQGPSKRSSNNLTNEANCVTLTITNLNILTDRVSSSWRSIRIRLSAREQFAIFNKDTAELKRLWLLEAYHGQGIGYQLVQTLLDFAKKAGYKRVRLLTDRRQNRAIHFYQQVGFQPSECHPEDPNDLYMEMGISNILLLIYQKHQITGNY